MLLLTQVKVFLVSILRYNLFKTFSIMLKTNTKGKSFPYNTKSLGVQ